jgi:hypothetical protein
MQGDMHILVGDDRNGLLFPEEVSLRYETFQNKQQIS